MTSPRSSSNPTAARAAAPPGAWSARLPGGAELVCFGRQAGDFADPACRPELEERSALGHRPWTWLHQVHGADVVVVDQAGAGHGAEADAAVCARAGLGLAVMTADCAPIGLGSPEGVAGVVHAGWRGLLAGVVGRAVSVMRELGASEVSAALGPCVRPHGYSFAQADLAQLEERLGATVRGMDDEGGPALDLPAAVAAALGQAGAALVADSGTCTHCSSAHWSWRRGREAGRQANVVLTGARAA